MSEEINKPSLDEAFSAVTDNHDQAALESEDLTATILGAITQIHTGVQGLQIGASVLSDRLNALEDWVFFLLSQNPKFMTVFSYAQKDAEKSGQAGGKFPTFPRVKTPTPTDLEAEKAIREKLGLPEDAKFVPTIEHGYCQTGTANPEGNPVVTSTNLPPIAVQVATPPTTEGLADGNTQKS